MSNTTGGVCMESNANNPTTLLELKGVSKVFSKDGKDVLVLEDVNLNIVEGEFVCILGPTGCGKSVTLQIVAGLIDQTTGSVELDGREEHGPGPHKGMVFQEYALLPWRSVVENVEIGLELKGIDKQERRRIAMEQLATVGLSGTEHQSVHEISVGMRQRVAIARALANNPKILLMDEPFEALDALTKEEMQIQILKVWEKTGTTILFVTHDVDEAIFLSDRICVMDINPGRVKKMLVNQLPRPRHECMSRTDEAFNDMRDEIISLYSSLKDEELDLII
ncbi:ABC transporter ATP-binding protein [Prosthecochloris sp.]|uniref:ABC transporter ATP-binding protein n=1 Tax=Prosthecochloris sp. TaxID=290513 RepID=UPI002579BE5C|nr:ABC transporter ATP-binding protein [Prosthecochloris sp.]